MHQVVIAFGLIDYDEKGHEKFFDYPKDFIDEVEKIKQKYNAEKFTKTFHPNPYAIELVFDLDFVPKNDGKLNPVLIDFINELYHNHFKQFGILDEFYFNESQFDDYMFMMIKI